MTAARKRKINSHTQSSSSSLYIHTHTQIQLTYLSFAWFQSWRPFWSYPLPVKSLTVADPFFFFQSRFVLFSSVVKMRTSREKVLLFLFFFSHPRLFSFFLSSYTREKKKISIAGRLRTHVSTSLDGRSSTSSSLSSSRPPVDVGFGGDGVHGVAIIGRYFLLFLSLGLSLFFFFLCLSLSAYFHFRSTTKR
jgi:hypothetical protein